MSTHPSSFYITYNAAATFSRSSNGNKALTVSLLALAPQPPSINNNKTSSQAHIQTQPIPNSRSGRPFFFFFGVDSILYCYRQASSLSLFSFLCDMLCYRDSCSPCSSQFRHQPRFSCRPFSLLVPTWPLENARIKETKRKKNKTAAFPKLGRQHKRSKCRLSAHLPLQHKKSAPVLSGALEKVVVVVLVTLNRKIKASHYCNCSGCSSTTTN